MQLYMLSTVLGLVAAVNASLGHSVIPRIKATDLVNRLAPLKWTGVVVPDQGSVTLTGSSNEDIYAQVMRINPNYNANFNSSGFSTSDKPGPCNSRVCGHFTTGDRRNIRVMMESLKKLGGHMIAEAGKCHRWACYNTSAVYLCNDNDFNVGALPEHLGCYVDEIMRTCCPAAHTGKAMSGQCYTPRSYNVVIGYGNCNHDATEDRPSDFVGDPGQNGYCSE